MTLEEFHVQQPTRPCITCGHKPVELLVHPNNNGTYIHCSLCGLSHAWTAPQVLFLKVSDRKTRDEYPDGNTLEEVWRRYGDHCFVCGLDRAVLADLKVGQERHHSKRYAEHGHDGGLIVPVCGRCHAFVSAIQMVVRVFLKKLEARDESIF